MDKIFLITMLYDFYGELLTEKQKSALEAHFLEDLSLNEIGTREGTTRQAVMDTVKRSEKLLMQYEEKLHLVEKYMERKTKANDAANILDNIIANASGDDAEKLNFVKTVLFEILD